MKTLDEVIKAFEYCQNPVDNFGNCNAECPYIHCCDPECTAVKVDAIHYLKELQKIEDEYDELKDWWAEEHAENVPLSWDELKQMEGKPVWVEIVAPDNWKAWFLISAIDDGFLWVFDSKGDAHNLPRVCLDTRLWQAYRKERE